MSLSIGIIGLPNVGKSTLFNALLKRQAALAASYPFATIEPNVGVVDVPDARLHKLAEIIRKEYEEKSENYPEKTTPATIKFIDIAGLVEGAHKGEGLGNQFLSHIREVDAVLHVIRGFEGKDVDRAGSVSPQADIDLINTELMLADLQTVENRIASRKFAQDRPFLTKIKESLEKCVLIRTLDLSDEQKEYVMELSLLTQKPVLLVMNVGEEKLAEKFKQECIPICAKLESDLTSFSENERKEYLAELGVGEDGLNLVIEKSYEILGLHSFFTPGPKEVRAWTIKKGAKAPQAAGEVHTDFERGFISSEVVDLARLEEVGSWKRARERGFLRMEGKNYVVQDGDIIQFRFNV